MHRSWGAGYAILRVPLSWWHRAGLSLPPKCHRLEHVQRDRVVIIQYLDDILCVLHDNEVLHCSHALQKAGSTISPTSTFDPVQSMDGMGKDGP